MCHPKGYLFTQARKLIGVELNEWFCKLQEDMVKKYKMGDRVQVKKKDYHYPFVYIHIHIRHDINNNM